MNLNFLNVLSSNPRLRILLAVVLAVLAFDRLLAWQEVLKHDVRVLNVSQQRLTQLRIDSKRAVWLQRAKQVAGQLRLLEARCYHAHSQVSLEAALREQLTSMVNSAGIATSTIAISAPLSDTDEATQALPPGMTLRVVKLGFVFDPVTFGRLLDTIAQSGRLLSVESLSVSLFPSLHVDMQLNAYARIDKQGAQQ